MTSEIEKSTTKRISLTIEKPIVEALDQYIKFGDGWGIIGNAKNESEYDAIDISRSGLIRYLISAYGGQVTQQGNDVYNRLKDDSLPVCYISIHTKNKTIIQAKLLVKKLVHAMVFIGIPITGYFDGNKVIYA